MEKSYAIEKSLELVEKSKIAMLGTNDQEGYPNVKAMMNLCTEGLKDIWFSTNTSSKRVVNIISDSKACVYYVDDENFMGLMLVGHVEVLQDDASREKLWFDGAENYYKKGVNDPDYSVLHFRATKGNFYHKQDKIEFVIE